MGSTARSQEDSYLDDSTPVCRAKGQLASWMVDEIASQEPKAERSLMHRYNIALVRSGMGHVWQPPLP